MATTDKVRMKRSSDGWHIMRYGRIPYQVHYGLGCGDIPNLGIDERNPAMHTLTQNLGRPGESLSVWMHKSIPRKFIEAVLYHELVEAELKYADNFPRNEAHIEAVKLEQQYVKKFFGEKRLDELLSWKKGNLDGYS